MGVSVLSILAGATDANPVNKVVQLLSDLEAKVQGYGVEAKRLHESCLFGVSRKLRVIPILFVAKMCSCTLELQMRLQTGTADSDVQLQCTDPFMPEKGTVAFGSGLHG